MVRLNLSWPVDKEEGIYGPGRMFKDRGSGIFPTPENPA